MYSNSGSLLHSPPEYNTPVYLHAPTSAVSQSPSPSQYSEMALPTPVSTNYAESTISAPVAAGYGDLPPRSILAELLDIYFMTTHLTYPFLHRARFLTKFFHAPSGHRPALSLVYAILAISAPYSPNPVLRGYAALYYLRSREQIEEEFKLEMKMGKSSSKNRFTLETVQTCVLLVLIEFGQGEND